MISRFRILIFLGALLVGSRPASLHADPSGQMPVGPSASSILLVASKEMNDPRFRKTVLVVTSHGSTGPIGVIVNRPQDTSLDKIFPDYPKAKDLSLFYGGPAFPGEISYLVRGGEALEGALTISSDTYLAYDMRTLEELLNGKRRYKDLRVMHGFASWAPGQLEFEIRRGGWYVLPLDEAVIFDSPPAQMWQELYNRANSITL